MKLITKRGMAVLMAAAIFGGTAGMAQPPGTEKPYFSDAAAHEKMDQALAQKAYVACLRSENRGVVKSALAHVSWMRLTLPDQSFDDLRAEVDRLATCSECPVIRTHAYLTALVFDHPEIFGGVREGAPDNEEALFKALNARLQNVLLSYAGRPFVR